MKKEIKLSEAKGKVLEGFEFSFYSDQAVLTFSDGSFATLGVDRGYDGDLTIQEEILSVDHFGDQQLVSLGIVSQEDLDRRRAAEREEA